MTTTTTTTKTTTLSPSSLPPCCLSSSTASNIISLIPYDVWVKIFVILGNVKDILRCSSVNRTFHQITMKEQNLWREISIRMYGIEITERSVSIYYQNDYMDMVLDENKRGALPTLEAQQQQHQAPAPAPASPQIAFPKSCYYRRNSTGYFFCCLITCIKWDRSTDSIRVYIDVRGEIDLRNPEQSGICLQRYIQQNQEQQTLGGFQFLSSVSTTPTINPIQWISELEDAEARVPGHYKGYLTYPAGQFQQKGTYMFCYANPRPWRGDYYPVPILTVEQDGRLIDTFMIKKMKIASSTTDTGTTSSSSSSHSSESTNANIDTNTGYASNAEAENSHNNEKAKAVQGNSSSNNTDKLQYTSIDSSPFDDDTFEIERSRWHKFVNPQVLNRTRSSLGGTSSYHWWALP